MRILAGEELGECALRVEVARLLLHEAPVFRYGVAPIALVREQQLAVFVAVLRVPGLGLQQRAVLLDGLVAVGGIPGQHSRELVARGGR